MTYLSSGIQDAFGRVRVSDLTTLFDSKQIHDNQPLFWDDQQVSGGGTTSVHSVNKAATTLSVSASTAGKRVRQTYQRFNYQPGKSQLIVMTAVMSSGAFNTGITAEVGYHDDNNGLFFRLQDGVIYAVRRTNVTGTPADIAVAQADWNIDTMDGNGPSGITIDPTKTQILFIDFEWLGVGRVRMGFFIDGAPVYCHQFLNANNLTTVYMSTPNLPLRYSIENDGTGGAASLDHICGSVASEGGANDNGTLRHESSGAITIASIGVVYPILGLRLKAGYPGSNVVMENIAAITTTVNDVVEWSLIFNPTITLNGGTFTYADLTNASTQLAISNGLPTAAGGIQVSGGYFTQDLPITTVVSNARRLGFSIGGTADTLVLCAKPITATITLHMAMTWRDLS
jgi:hypothetical protein